MADKTGMTDLLQVLERLCLDYRAMEYLLNHYHPDGAGWIRQLDGSRRANKSRVVHLFDEVRDSPQSDQFDVPLYRSLINALNKVTLLKPL